jgi:hypothetical protein
VRINELSFRFGKEIFAARPEQYASVLAAVVNSQESHLRKPSIPVEIHLRRELSAEGWNKSENVQPGFSFIKSRVAIEIEFSCYEYIYRDFVHFLAADKADEIDVGVIITNTREGMKRMKNKYSTHNYERVCHELEWLRPTLHVPLWIIGLK